MNPIRLTFLPAVLAICASVLADDKPSTTPSKIGTQDAAKYYDKTMTVTGKVAQVTERPTVVFINLDEAFPNSPFTGVIFTTNKPAFTNLSELKGKDVEITGKIKEYHDKPEIILTNASQLKVISDDKTSATAIVGKSPTFNVAGGTNGAPLTYQWYNNGANVSSTTNR